MGKYIIRRLLTGVLVVLCVTVIIFGIMQAMPGNPIDLMVDTRVSAEKVAELKARWGLDKPVIVQYFYWLGNQAGGALPHQAAPALHPDAHRYGGGH